MKIVATTTEQMLEAVLYRLHATGWQAVDVEKLVDAYVDFRDRTGRCVYGSRKPAVRDAIRVGIEDDIHHLVLRSRAQRTVSRVRLTQDGLDQAKWLKLEAARFGTLHDCAADRFPPLRPMKP